MSTSKHALELDVLTSLYHYLAKKNKNLESCPTVLIPQTIVYEHNFPIVWYQQTPGSREYKKKTGKELETKAILNEFTKNINKSSTVVSSPQQIQQTNATTSANATNVAGSSNNQGDEASGDLMSNDPNMANTDGYHGIIAQFLSQTEDEKTGETVLNVEFLDEDGLDDFLFKRKKRDKGILQQFVTPKGPYNFVIQAIWSPHVTMLERRVNIHRITDRKNYTPYERAVTYEGPSHYSNEVFCAPHLEKEIKRICTAIVEHFYNVEHKHITRMVLYFKVDPKNNVYLLWSSSIRIGSQKGSSGIATANTSLAPPKREPLNLSPKFSYNNFDTSENNGGGENSSNELKKRMEHRIKPKTPQDLISDSESACISGEQFSQSDVDRDEEYVKIKNDIHQELDDLLYKAYSHFLHNSDIDEKVVEFPFIMPSILLKAFGDDQVLAQLFSNREFKLSKGKDENIYILALKQASSMNKLQHQFSTLREYLLDCFENEGYYESNFKK